MKSYSLPLNINNGRVELSHGSGGRAMAQLIDELFVKAFDNEYLRQGNDGAVFSDIAGINPNSKIVMATDAHVVSPLFFAGGNIGALAVHGTVNDVAVMGATPMYLTASFILEEGFALKKLKLIVESMAEAAKEANVKIISGDTKVVERGKGDGIFISTTGFGIIPNSITNQINLSGDNAKVGDKVIISGTVGDHGMAIMSSREGLEFSSPIVSDSQSLHTLTAEILRTCPQIRCLRDPTRGGLATTINEIAKQSKVGVVLHEDKIPINPPVEAACEFLGLDPLYVANEGKLIAICPAEFANEVLSTMKKHPQGLESQIIGEVIADDNFFVQMQTKIGGRRIVDWLSGEQLPRIC